VRVTTVHAPKSTHITACFLLVPPRCPVSARRRVCTPSARSRHQRAGRWPRRARRAHDGSRPRNGAGWAHGRSHDGRSAARHVARRLPWRPAAAGRVWPGTGHVWTWRISAIHAARRTGRRHGDATTRVEPGDAAAGLWARAKLSAGWLACRCCGATWHWKCGRRRRGPWHVGPVCPWRWLGIAAAGWQQIRLNDGRERDWRGAGTFRRCVVATAAKRWANPLEPVVAFVAADLTREHVLRRRGWVKAPCPRNEWLADSEAIPTGLAAHACSSHCRCREAVTGRVIEHVGVLNWRTVATTPFIKTVQSPRADRADICTPATRPRRER
jgi:hypothetical protein